MLKVCSTSFAASPYPVVLSSLLLCASCTTPVIDSGPDLSTWRSLGDVAWRFGRREIEAGPDDRMGYLVSPRKYRDVRLSVEFYVDEATNSGVFLRCRNLTAADEVTPDNCYEINIWDDHPNQAYRTGSIVTLQTALIKVDTVGRWNRYDIVLFGDQITVDLNGQRVARYSDLTRSEGVLALQYGGEGKVMFRNLQIEIIE